MNDSNKQTLQLFIEQRNYSHISTYVYKAEAALEAAKEEKDPLVDASRPPTTSKRTDERKKIQTKLNFASGLSHLCQGSFAKAASHFLHMGPPILLGDWLGKVSRTEM